MDECKNPPMVDESTKKCPTETEKENPRYKSFGEVDLEQTKLVIDESDNSTDGVFLKGNISYLSRLSCYRQLSADI